MRLFSAILLALIPIYLGAKRKATLLQEGRIKAALLKLAEGIHFEIEAFSRPQNQIFSRFEDTTLEKIGFLPRLRDEVDRDPCGAFSRTLDFFHGERLFSPLEEEAWRDFALRFGMQSKIAQLEDLKKLLRILEKEEEKAKEKRASDAALAWTVGLCAGIGLFILII